MSELEKIFTLESKIAHLEHLLETLNTIVTKQADSIDQLKRENKQFKEKLRELSDWARPEISDEAPPHY